ncbi:hypothetical protein KC355_g22165, partial [Hortaea werneckii]
LVVDTEVCSGTELVDSIVLEALLAVPEDVDSVLEAGSDSWLVVELVVSGTELEESVVLLATEVDELLVLPIGSASEPALDVEAAGVVELALLLISPALAEELEIIAVELLAPELVGAIEIVELEDGSAFVLLAVVELPATELVGASEVEELEGAALILLAIVEFCAAELSSSVPPSS